MQTVHSWESIQLERKGMKPRGNVSQKMVLEMQ